MPELPDVIGVFLQHAGSNSHVAGDLTAGVRIDPGTGVGTATHGGTSYTFKVPGGQPPPVSAPAPTVPAQPSTGYDLDVTCGPGQQYSSIEDAMSALDAIAAAKQAGTDPTRLNWRIGVDPRGRYANLRPQHNPYAGYWGGTCELYALPMPDGSRKMVTMTFPSGGEDYTGKGPLIPMRKAAIRGFDLSAAQRDGSTAAIHTEAAPGDVDGSLIDLTVEDCRLSTWGMCILATTPGGGKLTLNRVELANGGDGSGQTHNIYAGVFDYVELRDVYSHEVNVGHLLKLRAKAGLIDGFRCFDLDNGSSSFAVNIPEGGEWVIRNGVIHKGVKASNGPALTFGEELKTALNPQGIVLPDSRPHSLALENITIVSDDDPNNAHLGTLGLWNRINQPLTNTGMKVWGPPRAGMMNNGTADVPMPGGVEMLTGRPVLDLSSPVFGNAP